MKKLLSIAVCASAISAFATETATVGTVGVTKIHSSLTNTVVAVSYADLATSDQIAVSNIVKTTNLTAGDRLHIFTGSSNYQTYVLRESGGNKYWEPTVAWALDSNGVLSETETPASNEITLAAGVGFWLVRNTGANGWNGQPFDFYTYGKPTTASATATDGKTKLIGNPLNVPARPTPSSPLNGDRVIVPDDTVAGGVVTYTYASAKGWWHWSGTGSSRTRVADGLPAIPAGTGCWYATSGNVSISWTPAN